MTRCFQHQPTIVAYRIHLASNSLHNMLVNWARGSVASASAGILVTIISLLLSHIFVDCRLRLFSFLCRFYHATAMLSAVYAVVLCLCVCVCVSATLRYVIKTAKRRITQITPHDSPMTLDFWRQRSRRNSNGITPYRGEECRWGGLKLVTFNEKTRYNSKTVKDRRIVSIKVE